MAERAVVGYPRIGERRELKKICEAYFKGKVTEGELKDEAKRLRIKQLRIQKSAGVEYISSNDFSFYDNFLDTAMMIDAVPQRYKALKLNPLQCYFAMARGYQKDGHDIKALPMKKWFNTNYHYITAEIGEDTRFSFADDTIVERYKEARDEAGLETKPVMIGAYSFLKLAYNKSDKGLSDFADSIAETYADVLRALDMAGVGIVQIDEPALVLDMSPDDIAVFKKIYEKVLPVKGSVDVLLQSYFGDLRDVYGELISMDFDALGIDFVEGKKSLELVKKYAFPKTKKLFAGVVNGKNVWRSDYEKALPLLDELAAHCGKDAIVISTSCSLLHSPYSIKHEVKMDERFKKHLAFAEEKLNELAELKGLFENDKRKEEHAYKENVRLIEEKKNDPLAYNEGVRKAVRSLGEDDFSRKEAFNTRINKQHAQLQLPPLPTTTIGSFPQTAEIRKLRRQFKKEEISKGEYEARIKAMIGELVKLQEEIGLDVLVHGEYERNDMVEYFGEQLDGFLFTENGWVQSYGTRGVKPPIIFGDISRPNPMTVEWISYAQSLTDKPMKGMLTGPVTILNWSFPRLDIELSEIAYQIGIAIRDELLDLEKAGIKVIQVDEAALREKLPLRKEDRKKDYLSWAIKAFRIVHSKAAPETQVHTHMCYSEFSDIIEEIKEMDADVITIEASRGDLRMLNVLKENGYDKEIGPGVYDIHSPRIPSVEEFERTIADMTKVLDSSMLWVNPDCGLKTRAAEETEASLRNMTSAVKKLRTSL